MLLCALAVLANYLIGNLYRLHRLFKGDFTRALLNGSKIKTIITINHHSLVTYDFKKILYLPLDSDEHIKLCKSSEMRCAGA